MVDAVDEVLNRIEQEKVDPELPEGIMALARCAIEALPYEVPKLSAVAHGHFDGTDFATQLERAIERSRQPLPLPSPTVIDHDPPVTAAEMKAPFSRYRRY